MMEDRGRRFMEHEYKGEFNLLDAEKEGMIDAIKKYCGVSVFVMKALQINRRAYYDKIKQHGLDVKGIVKEELKIMRGKTFT